MSEWLEAEAQGGAAEPVVKTPRTGSTSREAMQRELNLHIGCAQALHMNRQLQASWHSYITPKEVVTDAIGVNKAHNDKTKGISGHRYGPPHVQSYRTFLKTLLRLATQIKPDPNANWKEGLTIMEEHITNYEAKGSELGYQSVNQFRVKTTKEGKGVINYQLSDMLEPTVRYKIENSVQILVEIPICVFF